MRLDRVTITGADDSAQPDDVLALGREFPYVEWGILVSQRAEGSRRFPTGGWISRFVAYAPPDARLSLHICGRWLRQLLVGVNELPPGLWYRFHRVQLNFHGESLPCNTNGFREVLTSLGERQVIFQVDGNMGQSFLAEIARERGNEIDCVPLFDLSHGAGVLPAEWPAPFDHEVYHGYAGGLGPETLERELPRIAKAAGDCRIWIDMETRVRGDRGQLFDLVKVRRCLEICEPFIEGVR